MPRHAPDPPERWTKGDYPEFNQQERGYLQVLTKMRSEHLHRLKSGADLPGASFVKHEAAALSWVLRLIADDYSANETRDDQ